MDRTCQHYTPRELLKPGQTKVCKATSTKSRVVPIAMGVYATIHLCAQHDKELNDVNAAIRVAGKR